MSQCRSCKQEIRFVRTATGKLMPVDPKPVPYGNLEIVSPDGDTPTIAFVKPSMQERLRAHFATCPEAKKHRKVKAVPDAAPTVRKKRGKNEPTLAVAKAERERVAYETAMAGG